jgi:chromosome segregation ATPase
MIDSSPAEERPSSDKKSDEEFNKRQTAKGLIHFKGHHTDEWIKPNEVSLYRELEAVREKHAAKIELEKRGDELGKKIIELENKGTELDKKAIELENKGMDLENKGMDLEKKVIELEKKLEDAHNEEIEHLKKLDADRKRESAEYEKKMDTTLKEMRALEQQMRVTAHEISAESTTIRSIRWGEETKKLLEKKK